MTRLPSGPRLALAADLNDLIAHRIAAVQVQAAAAERLLGDRCQAARALQAVRGLTAEAMDELRRLARLLDDDTPVPLEPAPSGVPGLTDPLPGGVALCAYRCVELLSELELRFAVRDTRLEIRCAGELDPRREAALRAFVRPCAGSVRRHGGHWSIMLPLEP